MQQAFKNNKMKIMRKYETYFSILNYSNIMTKNHVVASVLQKYALSFYHKTNIMPLAVAYIRKRKLFIIMRNPEVHFRIKKRYFKYSYIEVVT